MNEENKKAHVQDGPLAQFGFPDAVYDVDSDSSNDSDSESSFGSDSRMRTIEEEEEGELPAYDPCALEAKEAQYDFRRGSQAFARQAAAVKEIYDRGVEAKAAELDGSD